MKAIFIKTTLKRRVQKVFDPSINMALQILREWFLSETCNAYIKSLFYWSCAFIKIYLLTLTISNLITSLKGNPYLPDCLKGGSCFETCFFYFDSRGAMYFL